MYTFSLAWIPIPFLTEFTAQNNLLTPRSFFTFPTPFLFCSSSTHPTQITLEVDTATAHKEILQMTEKIKAERSKENERKEEMIRIHQQMKAREQKANELRRKHQVRQNFRAAVKRAIIQYVPIRFTVLFSDTFFFFSFFFALCVFSPLQHNP